MTLETKNTKRKFIAFKHKVLYYIGIIGQKEFNARIWLDLLNSTKTLKKWKVSVMLEQGRMKKWEVLWKH